MIGDKAKRSTVLAALFNRASSPYVAKLSSSKLHAHVPQPLQRTCPVAKDCTRGVSHWHNTLRKDRRSQLKGEDQNMLEMHCPFLAILRSTVYAVQCNITPQMMPSSAPPCQYLYDKSTSSYSQYYFGNKGQGNMQMQNLLRVTIAGLKDLFVELCSNKSRETGRIVLH